MTILSVLCESIISKEFCQNEMDGHMAFLCNSTKQAVSTFKLTSKEGSISDEMKKDFLADLSIINGVTSLYKTMQTLNVQHNDTINKLTDPITLQNQADSSLITEISELNTQLSSSTLILSQSQAELQILKEKYSLLENNLASNKEASERLSHFLLCLKNKLGIEEGSCQKSDILDDVIVSLVTNNNAIKEHEHTKSKLAATIKKLNDVSKREATLRKMNPESLQKRLDKQKKNKDEHKVELAEERSKHRAELEIAKQWKTLYSTIQVEQSGVGLENIEFNVYVVNEPSKSRSNNLNIATVDLPFTILVHSSTGIYFEVQFTYFGTPIYPAIGPHQKGWPREVNNQVHLCLIEQLGSSKFRNKRTLEIMSQIEKIKKVSILDLDIDEFEGYYDIILACGCKTLWGAAALSSDSFVSAVQSNLVDDTYAEVKIRDAHQLVLEFITTVCQEAARIRKFSFAA
ncbi:hypothetical protein AB6C73_09170 [Vibrio splendidus]